MTPASVLIANRGEVAVRISRAAAGLGTRTIGLYTHDDRESLHVARCDEAVLLPGTGAAGYLDIPAVVRAALDSKADAVHPGYGLLSENRQFAQACAEAGLVFIGPKPDTLELFGDKGRARDLAAANGVPTLAGTSGPTDLAGMQAFFDELGGNRPVLVKALAGGGGRGMRVVRRRADLPSAVEVCRREAEASFGAGDLYVEQLLDDARHIEVQVLGDGTGDAVHLWDRDCSVQRRHQKLVEIAPSAGLDPVKRAEMLAAAVRLARAVRYRGLLTVEMLVAADGDFYFMEGNPRLQVEHTVTEEVLGLDLVQAQLQVCTGATLADIGLTEERVPRPRGVAIQIRLNAETVGAAGDVVPGGGCIAAFAMPTGPGARVDTAACVGYRVNPRFDSLVAKIIAHDRGFDEARRLALRLLSETQIAGIPTNLALQMSILDDPVFVAGRHTTAFVDTHLEELLARQPAISPAVVEPGNAAADPASAAAQAAPAEGTESVPAPVPGVVVAVEVAEGAGVSTGQTLVVLEAMKMHYTVTAPDSGVVTALLVKEGDVVDGETPLVYFRPGQGAEAVVGAASEQDLDAIPDKLAEIRARKALLLDDARPEAVSRRAGKGMRTARQNIADLVDDDTFVEYGGFAVAAQRSRRELDDLVRRTPADGIVTGTGSINGERFDADRATCAVLAYDYTVLAGTQGYWNHRKTDRVLEIARKNRYPVVLFAEGGGGRPGDLDVPTVAALNTRTFSALAELSGTVPTVGIAAGRCFAGNAALLGVCDVIIATRDSTIGMGGPAMIEGGGLGIHRPEEIGPIEVQTANGVVDIEVADEAAAVAAAKQYLAYFQGDSPVWEEHDQRRLRHVVPADRKRVYDVHQAIDLIFDVGSVLELRPAFGRTIVTALARLRGRSVGVVANNPLVLGGAIDSPGADKMARFLQLCNVFGLPVVSLCDTPGFMVGPEAEKTASVRHFARLFLRGASLTVPTAMVVLRKAYGLGAVAMGGGCTENPSLTVSWPDGEFGGMGLEGAVRLGFRDELRAIADPAKRQARYDELVAAMYERGKALNTAMHLELDDVIDPADTRHVLSAALPRVPHRGWTNEDLRPSLDAW